MNKKLIIQFLLFVILLIIIISVFFLYFNNNENIKETNLIINNTEKSKVDNKTATLINDISYVFSDSAGNKYELFAEIGEVDLKNSDQMFMTNVEAVIYLKNSSPVKIFSKYANYNKVTHESNFIENVRVFHLIHKATSENLDISFTNNKASMYNNIVYIKPGTQLNADRLEIDLITKNSKIFMDNESEKIKIIDNK